jgi:hypothetical protein
MTTLNGPTVSGLKIQGFATEEDPGTVEVLRYLPLGRFLYLLELEAMWFSRLGALQDKFECTNPKGPRAFLLRIVSDPDFKNAKTPLGGSYSDLLAMTDNGRSGDVGRKMGLVNCWFIGKTESEKMWKHYGDDGKGIAIRSTVKRLAASFQIPGDYALVSRVGRIEYVDFEAFDLGCRGEDMAYVPFIKTKPYVEENEVRILTLNSFHSGTLLPDGSQPTSAGFDPEVKGLYIKCHLQGLIQSVVVGPNTDWSFHMLMKRLVARYGLTINVEHSKVSPFTDRPAEGQGPVS